MDADANTNAGGSTIALRELRSGELKIHLKQSYDEQNITLVVSSHEAYEIRAALPIQVSYCQRQLKVGLCLLSKYLTAVYARAASPIQVSVYARAASPIQQSGC